jgi:hypothetical protein
MGMNKFERDLGGRRDRTQRLNTCAEVRMMLKGNNFFFVLGNR